jgi:hypothetical protein
MTARLSKTLLSHPSFSSSRHPFRVVPRLALSQDSFFLRLIFFFSIFLFSVPRLKTFLIIFSQACIKSLWPVIDGVGEGLHARRVDHDAHARGEV